MKIINAADDLEYLILERGDTAHLGSIAAYTHKDPNGQETESPDCRLLTLVSHTTNGRKVQIRIPVDAFEALRSLFTDGKGERTV